MQRVPEVVPGYPDRILPVDEAAAAILKKRTLTNLYSPHPRGPVSWIPADSHSHAKRASGAGMTSTRSGRRELLDEILSAPQIDHATLTAAGALQPEAGAEAAVAEER